MDSLRMAGLGSRKKVHGLGEVSRGWRQLQTEKVMRTGDERVWLQERTERQTATILIANFDLSWVQCNNRIQDDSPEGESLITV